MFFNHGQCSKSFLESIVFGDIVSVSLVPWDGFHQESSMTAFLQAANYLTFVTTKPKFSHDVTYCIHFSYPLAKMPKYDWIHIQTSFPMSYFAPKTEVFVNWNAVQLKYLSLSYFYIQFICKFLRWFYFLWQWPYFLLLPLLIECIHLFWICIQHFAKFLLDIML